MVREVSLLLSYIEALYMIIKSTLDSCWSSINNQKLGIGNHIIGNELKYSISLTIAGTINSGQTEISYRINSKNPLFKPLFGS